MTAAQAWPNTQHEAPRTDDRWRSVAWLLGRHPQLARLADRIPVCIGDFAPLDDDGKRLLADWCQAVQAR